MRNSVRERARLFNNKFIQSKNYVKKWHEKSNFVKLYLIRFI